MEHIFRNFVEKIKLVIASGNKKDQVLIKNVEQKTETGNNVIGNNNTINK
jgi:hypothetical protein